MIARCWWARGPNFWEITRLHKHIYRGCDDVAYCPPHMLGSWDCKEQIEVLQRGGGLNSTQSRWRRASQPRRRSQSSSHHCSQTLAWGNRDGHSCGSSPHMPSRSHCGATVPPCTPSMCYCRAATFPNVSTTPKAALMVNVPSHAWSSHSSEGMARVSLDEDDAWMISRPHTHQSATYCGGRMMAADVQLQECQNLPGEAQGSKQSTT